MRPIAPILTVAIFYALHQDFWFWREARPLVFGFLPVGLFYHVMYVLGAAALFWILTARYWPGHLDRE